jgi:3-methyl-2-oxobutanoate hydroxymethyltransferase
MVEETAPYGAGVGSSSQATSASIKRLRTHHLLEMKQRGEKITMLTSYDMYTAQIFDEAGIDLLLVGDSASNNVFGYTTSLPVTVDELLPLARAVAQSARRAIVVCDLPFGSYQSSPEQAYHTATRFMKEASAHCIKMEGGKDFADHIRLLVRGGIPVMAHVGFTPQSEHTLGGYRVQGRGKDSAAAVMADALAVQEAGAFCVLMEMVPGPVATDVSQALDIPTIGIGGGNGCDGQVLVWQDAFGLRTGKLAKFVKKYADLHSILSEGARQYATEVRDGTFPGQEHTF